MTESDRGRLIIVCGLPGAGKTTHSREIVSSSGGVRFCADEWMRALGFSVWDEQLRDRVEKLQWTQAQELLAASLTVVIEWGTWGRTERDALRQGARALGARVELHYLSAPLNVLYQRVQARDMERPPITRADLSEWARMFQAPTTEELALYDHGTVVEQRFEPHCEGGSV